MTAPDAAAAPPVHGGDEPARGPLAWKWPLSPPFLRVYDKYADMEVDLSGDAEDWVVPVRGNRNTYRFAAGADGVLQRKIVILTQANRSPSAIEKFTGALIRSWPLYKQLLTAGPLQLRKHWAERVADIDTALSGKTALRLACSASVGPWNPIHLPLIKSLDTRARNSIVAQHGRLRRRESILGIDTQAALARILDERASESSLSEQEAEGLAALAMYYQHGVRPVQILSLRVEHVRMFRDVDDDPACVISFHAAKQAKDGEFEMVRQVRPEWATFIEQLLAFAEAKRRGRLFTIATAEKLWTRVKAVCATKGVKLDFTAYALRHTAAQALADAGHDRGSIRHFLGHTNADAAHRYLQASQKLSDRVNAALGTSKLYGNVLLLAEGKFVSRDDMVQAMEDQQIGAVVGARLIAGVGLCRTGQSHCPFNPVTSCYGCSKFMPSLDRSAHEEAVTGMREQVLMYLKHGAGVESPAYRQLMRALAGAQEALQAIAKMQGQLD